MAGRSIPIERDEALDLPSGHGGEAHRSGERRARPVDAAALSFDPLTCVTETVDVLIAGGGPTGLALANALGRRGVDVLVVEQDADVASLPRAVSIDDEAMRFMQALGLGDAAARITLPGTGTKYYGARGQLLGYARGPERHRYGHPIRNAIDHPEFQRMLLDGLRDLPGVATRHRTRLVGFEQDADAVVAQVESDGRTADVACRYLVGADGGRSLVRTLIGQEPMRGSAFEERWLVLDTVRDQHDQRHAMHHGDPQRPRVVVVGPGGRCRYEFLLHDDEQPQGDELLALATRLAAPYRRLDPADVVRCTVYRFYALVADAFSLGRVFLAGDAAHLMPPFAGQGLNSGLRDAANLSWKLAAVLGGTADARLLDTYTAERQPHVQAMVRLSVRMGSLLMTRSRLRARARDAAFAVGRRVPALDRFVREMRFKPAPRYRTGFLVGSDAPAGSLLVQPRVLDRAGAPAALDDVLGDGFALLGVDVAPDALAAPLWARLDATRVRVALDDRPAAPAPGWVSVTDVDGLLAEQLGSVRGSVVLVRPDRHIAGAFTPAAEPDFAARVERLLGGAAIPAGAV
jgi:3-(3-hydroxy-phenyl)propionate hydroxylase